MNTWESEHTEDPTTSDEDTTLLLNFQNHCLLCLQHEDPAVLRQIAIENPKGLLDFQPIMSYLSGIVNPIEQGKDDEGENPEGQYYPVTKNLPPLCKLCYDILAELHLFHCELMELQRKIQNQTEAARRIVRGTMRKRGGMRAEFFNRLKIAGIPKGDVQAIELFIGNFHDLIVEAEQKAVLPQLIPLSSSQSPSTMQPYHVEFVEPVDSASSSALSPPIRISAPFQVRKPAFLLQIDAQAEKNDNDGVFNVQGDPSTSSVSSSSQNHVLLVDEENPDVAYEYEGDEETEQQHHEMLEDENEDDVVVLEDEDEGEPNKLPAAVVDEEDYQSDSFNELEEGEDESDEEMDLEYWKSVLSSSLIMEQVEDEEEDEEERMEENVPTIQVNQNQPTIQDRKVQRKRQVINHGVIPQPIVLSVMSCSTSPSGKISQMPSLSLPKMKQRPPPPLITMTNSSRVRYKCRYCDKSYKARQRLRYHEQVHLPGGRPKPFLCGQCQKGFSTRKLLEQHERVHTGERPCVCEICGDRFRQSSTLYRHRMAHKRQQQRMASIRARVGTPPPSNFFSENIK